MSLLRALLYGAKRHGKTRWPLLQAAHVLVHLAVSFCGVARVCHPQVEDWFTLKDTCPYALYDDQSRLYAAVLRMQLRCVRWTTRYERKGRTSRRTNESVGETLSS